MKELESIDQLESLRKEVKILEDREIREMSYEETMDLAIEELMNTDASTIPTWGWQELEDVFGFLKGGQLYVVGGITGTGKSTFVSQICQNISRQGFRCSFYSLEDRIQTVRLNDLYFEVNRQLKSRGLHCFSKVKFMNGDYKNAPEVQKARKTLIEKNKLLNYLKHDSNVTIKVIEQMITEAHKKGSRVVAIDHLHYFDSSDKIETDRHDLVIKDLMHRINRLARELNIAIILVAQYKKLARGEKPTLNDFSGSISISQVANGIIHIYRDKNDDLAKTEFIIDKNRDMGITKTLSFDFDLFTYEYKYTESQAFKERITN